MGIPYSPNVTESDRSIGVISPPSSYLPHPIVIAFRSSRGKLALNRSSLFFADNNASCYGGKISEENFKTNDSNTAGSNI
jgi:hypothetical protein